MELLGLRDGVGSGGGVHDEELFVRRLPVVLGERAVDLAQFVHQVRPVVQPAGGVAEEELDVLPVRRRVGVVAQGGGVGIVLALDHFHPDAPGPDAELLDGGGAEGIRRGQEHGPWRLVLRKFASLAVEVVLPVPLTPTTRMTRGRSGNGRSGRAAGGNRARISSRVTSPTISAVMRCPPAARVWRMSRDFERQRHAEVGADEAFLQFVPVHRPTGELLDERFEKAEGHEEKKDQADQAYQGLSKARSAEDQSSAVRGFSPSSLRVCFETLEAFPA